jgi:hypothetical protein
MLHPLLRVKKLTTRVEFPCARHLIRSTCMPYPRCQRSSWTRIKSSKNRVQGNFKKFFVVATYFRWKLKYLQFSGNRFHYLLLEYFPFQSFRKRQTKNHINHIIWCFALLFKRANPYLQAQQLQVQVLGAAFFFLASFFAFCFSAILVFTNVILVYRPNNVKYSGFSTAFEANFYKLIKIGPKRIEKVLRGPILRAENFEQSLSRLQWNIEVRQMIRRLPKPAQCP